MVCGSFKMPDYIRPFPCEECLVVAACIGRLTHERYVDNANVYSLIIRVLCPICPDLNKYITPYDYYDYSLPRRQKTVEFFSEKIK